VGPSYQTQRQEAFASLSEIAAKNPALMQVAGDLIFRAGDFPMADELADRLEKTLPPGLADDKNEPIPPQAQAKIAQLTQQTQQMGQMLDAAEQEVKKLQESESGKQANVMKAQNDQQKTQIDAQIRAQELALKERELQLKEQELQVGQYEAETERERLTLEMALKQKQASEALTADQAKTLFNGELQIVLQQMKDEAAEKSQAVDVAATAVSKAAETDDEPEEPKEDPTLAIAEAIKGLTEQFAKGRKIIRGPDGSLIGLQ